jgi:hypothetical protein
VRIPRRPREAGGACRAHTQVGVRDTRKIVGKYDLTGDDVRGEARFEDSVGIFPEFIDGYNILVLPTTGRYFQVPYRCMQSPEYRRTDTHGHARRLCDGGAARNQWSSRAPCVGSVDNLLVAGRCVAGDKTSHAAMRNMMAWCALL